ncbi:MAG: Ribokinase [Candidatus Moranbacteria bacterium GW2011_GWD2_36_12]|nr:MAG: Ribokinase [Candidatus Moranbacteria bacterium GW2011_GWD2_36_12]KKQ05610.1 MAG: Ribokinase [Candidatus Moranbacteria bacterium GW2011_GWE2_36_40]
MKIICIGSATKDIFFPTSEGLIFDTPLEITSQKKIAFELGAKYQVKERWESIGGCAANVAQGLTKLGEQAECYSKIGDDELGHWIKKTLTQGGVGTETLEIEKECKSDLSFIIVDINSGERTIFSNRDANDKLVIMPEKLNRAHWIFISSLNGNWQKHIREILDIAKVNKIRIAFNPGQKNIKTDLSEVANAINVSEIFFVNKDEAIEIVGGLGENTILELLENEEYLVKVLYKLGPKVVVITDGERGAWCYGGDRLLHCEALLMRKVVDTTGAGDAFTSGFFAAYLKRKNLGECLKWGIVNSSNSVTEYGGQKGLLNKVEIEKIAAKVVIS